MKTSHTMLPVTKEPAPEAVRVNLGCGRRRSPGWLNFDLFRAPDVIYHDLRQRLPLADSTVDVVYHSHVLEHFSRREGLSFLRECYRILKKGGVIRVVVPDLEGIVRAYLSEVDRLRLSSSHASATHSWLVIELYDQVVRSHSGGDMAEAFRTTDPVLRDFIIARLGTEARAVIDSQSGPPTAPNKHSISFGTRQIKSLLTRLRFRLASWFIGLPTRVLYEASFRETGENHRWMYDEFSLRAALASAGFSHASRVRADESGVEGWTSFLLDTEPNGSVYKPDSLFIEAYK